MLVFPGQLLSRQQFLHYLELYLELRGLIWIANSHPTPGYEMALGPWST